MNCHCCAGPTKKCGRFRNVNRLVQRYRCNRCGKTFSESQPLDGIRTDFADASKVVHLLVEGMGIRAISRVTGLCQETVLNILESAGAHCAALLDAKVRDVEAKHVEIDEIYGFVGCLQTNTDPDDPLHGDQYGFLAIES